MSAIIHIVDDFSNKRPMLMGRIFALLCAFSMGSMPISLKMVNKELSPVPVGSIMSLLGISGAYLIFGCLMGQSIYNLDKKLRKILLLRGVGGFSAVCTVLANKLLPPQKSIVLINTISIWVVIFSPFVLKEYPNKLSLCMLCMSFLGVILLVDPSLILPKDFMANDAVEEEDYPAWLLAMPLLTAIVAAFVTMMLRAYAGRITSFQNSGHFFIFGAFAFGFTGCLLDLKGNQLIPSLKDLFWITLAAIGSLGFQIFLALAGRFEKRAGVISMLLTSQILFTYTMDYFFLGHSINKINVVGGVLIATSSVVIATSKEVEEKGPSVEKTGGDVPPPRIRYPLGL